MFEAGVVQVRRWNRLRPRGRRATRAARERPKPHGRRNSGRSRRILTGTLAPGNVTGPPACTIEASARGVVYKNVQRSPVWALKATFRAERDALQGALRRLRRTVRLSRRSDSLALASQPALKLWRGLAASPLPGTRPRRGFLRRPVLRNRSRCGIVCGDVGFALESRGATSQMSPS